MTRRRETRRLATALFIALLGFSGCGPRQPPPPNILLVVVDTLRRDHLGCYGAARETSPAMDALAAEGARFDAAYSPAPWTMPAVASILTGLYPSAHGVQTMTRSLPPRTPTLATLLVENGFATEGIVSHFLIGRERNYGEGFEAFHEVHDTRTAGGHDHISTPEVTRIAQDALRRFAPGKRPFFLFVHYFDPHYNYLRHPEHAFAAPSAGRLTGQESIKTLYEMAEGLTPEEVRFIEDLYDEEIRFTDAGIGRLLDTLRDLGLESNTVVVVTSDHGEEFLDHRGLGHTRTLYDELVRVPLIIRDPRAPDGGRVSSSLVSLVGLAPTLLELAGIAADAAAFHEASFAPDVSGNRSAPPETLFCEVDFIPINKPTGFLLTRKKAVVTDRYKLIRDDRSGQVELYERGRDPDELRDLVLERPDLVEALLPVLEERIAFARGGRVFQAPGDANYSDEEIDRLRALGYVGGGD